MSFPWDLLSRGCAAKFPQPVSEDDEKEADHLVEAIHHYNCEVPSQPLAEIVYRNSYEDEDIMHHVFRWDTLPYRQAFEQGFYPRRQDDTPDAIYFSLDQYVHNAGRPLESDRPTRYAFISTTLSSSWCPSLAGGSQTELEVYRYEMYAPGGIWVAQTLRDRYQYPAQDEVCFVGGIAPQYIRSAQLFRLSLNAGTRYTRRERVDNIIRVNRYFNPQAYPQRLIPVQRPVFDYLNTQDGRRAPLTISIYPASLLREKRQLVVSLPEKQQRSVDLTDWYTSKVATTDTYINAAFRSSRSNEVYLFMKNEYVLLNYAPGTTNDKVLNGPLLICDGYPSLIATSFGEHGIDCAFTSHDSGNKAYIFSGNLCAYIDYAPGTTDDKIIKGPMTITAMFPFFKGTVFESGIDAAFESTAKYEAYLFKGNQYALINYGSDSRCIAIRPITEGFFSLRNTIFESGFDAAFASHRTDEAYLFKEDYYALINFAPGTTNDYIIGGIKKILPNWPSLTSILPRKNYGIDVHNHAHADADRDHDEL